MGILWRLPNRDFLGSCLAYRWGNHFLTAQHCVGALAASDVAVELPGLTPLNAAEEIERHPTADLAVVKIPPFRQNPTDPFSGIRRDLRLGETFHAYGWPEEFGGDGGPTPRLFTGFFQRFIQAHRSHSGFTYRAAEMSIGCPGGLSGAPLFNLEYPGTVWGIAVENVDAVTVLDAVSEVQADGSMYKEVTHRVLTYGISLTLADVADWLDGVSW